MQFYLWYLLIAYSIVIALVGLKLGMFERSIVKYAINTVRDWFPKPGRPSSLPVLLYVITLISYLLVLALTYSLSIWIFLIIALGYSVPLAILRFSDSMKAAFSLNAVSTPLLFTTVLLWLSGMSIENIMILFLLPFPPIGIPLSIRINNIRTLYITAICPMHLISALSLVILCEVARSGQAVPPEKQRPPRIPQIPTSIRLDELLGDRLKSRDLSVSERLGIFLIAGPIAPLLILASFILPSSLTFTTLFLKMSLFAAGIAILIGCLASLLIPALTRKVFLKNLYAILFPIHKEVRCAFLANFYASITHHAHTLFVSPHPISGSGVRIAFIRFADPARVTRIRIPKGMRAASKLRNLDPIIWGNKLLSKSAKLRSKYREAVRSLRSKYFTVTLTTVGYGYLTIIDPNNPDYLLQGTGFYVLFSVTGSPLQPDHKDIQNLAGLADKILDELKNIAQLTT